MIFKGIDIPLRFILIGIVLLMGVNYFTNGAITNPIYDGFEWAKTFGHPVVSVSNNFDGNKLNLPEPAEGFAWAMNKSTEQWEQVAIQQKTVGEQNTLPQQPGADIYGVVKLNTLAWDASNFAGLVRTLQSMYPGYTVKVYDTGRERLATQTWVEGMNKAVETFASQPNSAHADDWASQTKKTELENSNTVFLFKANGDGYDLVIPATWAADDTQTKVVELKARNPNMGDWKEITTSVESKTVSGSQDQISSGTSGAELQAYLANSKTGADRFGTNSGSSSSGPSGAGTDRF